MALRSGGDCVTAVAGEDSGGCEPPEPDIRATDASVRVSWVGQQCAVTCSRVLVASCSRPQEPVGSFAASDGFARVAMVGSAGFTREFAGTERVSTAPAMIFVPSPT